MNAGRWYPTNTTLRNGDALVLSGTFKTGDQTPKNLLPQVWQPTSGTWRNLTDAQEAAPLGVDLYPRMFVLPDGRLYKVGPDQDTWFLDTAGTGGWSAGPRRKSDLRTYGAAVMFAPGKILVVGGGRVDPNDTIPADDAVATAEVIDFTLPDEDDRVWQPVAPMQFPRRQLNATLLPDGKVLVTGGVGGPGFNNETNPMLAAEIWDPETKTWTTLASMQVTRGYHSTAMLLPDGRVVSAGGGQGAGATSFHNDAELFSPPYLFKGLRPTIVTAPDSVTYGQTFFVGTPDAANIKNVNLIRLPSVTHSFDENQRFNSLPDPVIVNGGLNVTAPAGPNLAPPGHYMLFILDRSGVPSVAKIIQITNGVAPSVTLGIAPATLAEAAGTATVTATLSASSALNVTVYLGFSGTATNGNDNTRSAAQIVIAAGNTTGTVTLTAVQDTLYETNETIVLTISGVINGIEFGTQQVTATITDDDFNAWHNLLNRRDVNADNFITALDALIIFNWSNSGGAGPFNPATVPLGPPFYDVNDDRNVIPLDALIIFNHLNSGGGEGERATVAMTRQEADSAGGTELELTDLIGRLALDAALARRRRLAI